MNNVILNHLDLWTGAVTKKSSSGRGSNGKVELTGVKKLRELILELALSGRLVEPEPDEEPAQSLLAKIEAEKARLTAQGLIKKPKKLAEAGDSQPYSTTDKAEPKQVADNTWVLELEDIEKESSRLLNKVRYTERQFKSSKNRFERGDVLYGKLRPYLDKVLVADEPGVCTTEIIPIRGYLGLLPEFLRLALKSPSFKLYANDSTHGMNLPRLGTDKARLAMIPLAPEQEQHRIVQKVDELMALCDRLEQQTSDQLEAHETLVDTLLGSLLRNAEGSLTQSENATELADNWARLAAHFDTLFTTEQSIDKLKQTILQLAVMGRLVEQDEHEESADRLLTSLSASPVKTDESPFSIPSNWRWTRLGSISRINGGFAFKSSNYQKTGVRVVRISDFDEYGFKNEAIVRHEYTEKLSGFQLAENDILMAMTGGTVGKSYLVEELPEPMVVNQRVATIKTPAPIYAKYIYFLLKSKTVREVIENAKNSTNDNISMKDIQSFLVPLPPAIEQHRIVQKVDELMALCEQLKGRLNQASETRCHLAEAVVEGALN